MTYEGRLWKTRSVLSKKELGEYTITVHQKLLFYINGHIYEYLHEVNIYESIYMKSETKKVELQHRRLELDIGTNIFRFKNS